MTRSPSIDHATSVVPATAAPARGGLPLPSALAEIPPRRSRATLVAGCIAAWLAASLLFSTQFYVADLARGRSQLGWFGYLQNELVGWGSFLVALPAIVAVSRRFPLVGRGALRNLLVHAVAASLLFAVMVVVGTTILYYGGVLPRNVPLGRLIGLRATGSFAAGWLIYAAIVMVHHTVVLYDAYRSRETRAAQLEARLTKAQLDVLKMQLHPHFLFNTLHAISGLMGRDVGSARRMMTRLSDLLRLSLENETTQEVPLAEELEFLARYVEIQEMRFEDRLTVDVDVEPSAAQTCVPKLLLQPLVENAIRHGISRVARAGLVELRARVHDGRLRIEIHDNGIGLDAVPPVEGVGLRNTRERLRQLYGDAHTFVLAERPGGGTMVVVELPARSAQGGGRSEGDAMRDASGGDAGLARERAWLATRA